MSSAVTRRALFGLIATGMFELQVKEGNAARPLRELRLINLRCEKSRGLVGRLLRR
ncbi:MAG: hypothetical protein QF570_02515 [Myxococcota bacterium]|jgi:hypothetical protein|nr:hypothetical protein [Myxococcota bacterium]